MTEECTHNCSTCGQNCDHRIEKATPLPDVKIGKIIGILSGKGGVGKSLVSSLLAVELSRKGYKVGILDADITGPSIAKVFGMDNQLMGDESGVFPAESRVGIKAVSVNMMLETEDTPVLWRGPIVGNMVTQFFSQVHWGELDYLLIDMPPGTSDVALSALQTIPVDSLIMVTSPSKLVSMIVGKTINLGIRTNTEILGLVENMAYIKCPDCGREISLYRNDATEETAKKYNLELLAKLPIDPELSNLTDEGLIDDYQGNYLAGVIKELESES